MAWIVQEYHSYMKISGNVIFAVVCLAFAGGWELYAQVGYGKYRMAYAENINTFEALRKKEMEQALTAVKKGKEIRVNLDTKLLEETRDKMEDIAKKHSELGVPGKCQEVHDLTLHLYRTVADKQADLVDAGKKKGLPEIQKIATNMESFILDQQKKIIAADNKLESDSLLKNAAKEKDKAEAAATPEKK